MENNRNFNIIQKIKHLEDLVDLLKLPRFKLKIPIDLKPEEVGNSAVEKAYMIYYPRNILEVVNINFISIKKSIYSLGIVNYCDKFDYLVFTIVNEKISPEEIKDKYVKYLSLENILKYKTIEKYI